MLGYFIAAAVVLIAIATFVNPFTGLMGLMAVFVIRPGELYPQVGILHAERVLGILVFISMFFNRGKLILPQITKRLLAFWGVMLLGVLFAYWRSAAFWGAADFFKIVLYHILIVNIVDTPKRFKAMLLLYAVLIGFISLTALYSYHSGDAMVRNGFERAVGITSAAGDPNSLGVTVVSGLPLILLFASKQHTFLLRLLAISVAMISIFTVVYTGSRTAGVALLFVAFVFGITRKQGLLYLPIFAIVFLTVWMVIPQNYQGRFRSIEDRDTDLSYTNRVRAWHAGWQMFKDYPLTGVGTGVFPNANGARYWPGYGRKIWLQPHSLYVQLLAEQGTLGVIAFAAFLFAIFSTNFKIRRGFKSLKAPPIWAARYPLACNLTLLVLLFAGYAGHSLYRQTWYLMGALTASLYVLMQKNAFAPPAEEPPAEHEEWDTLETLDEPQPAG